jgi:hypothetical protein
MSVVDIRDTAALVICDPVHRERGYDFTPGFSEGQRKGARHSGQPAKPEKPKSKIARPGWV